MALRHSEHFPAQMIQHAEQERTCFATRKLLLLLLLDDEQEDPPCILSRVSPLFTAELKHVDRLCSLVVRGPGFDYQRYQIF
jgi:hypothetical protein